MGSCGHQAEMCRPYLFPEVEASIARRENWVLRRQRGLPSNRRLFVLTCMDERVPIAAILGLQPGDAHIFRNAGGIVTDDAIRSAMLSCNFFGTREIVLVMHTECGMMAHYLTPPDLLLRHLQSNLELAIPPWRVPLDPTLPEFALAGEPRTAFLSWIRLFPAVNAVCACRSNSCAAIR